MPAEQVVEVTAAWVISVRPTSAVRRDRPTVSGLLRLIVSGRDLVLVLVDVIKGRTISRLLINYNSKLITILSTQ